MGGYSLVVVCELLIVVTSPCRAQTRGLAGLVTEARGRSSCCVRAYLPCSTWDLPGKNPPCSQGSPLTVIFWGPNGITCASTVPAALQFVRAEFKLILKSEQSEEQEIFYSVCVWKCLNISLYNWEEGKNHYVGNENTEKSLLIHCTRQSFSFFSFLFFFTFWIFNCSCF